MEYNELDPKVVPQEERDPQTETYRPQQEAAPEAAPETVPQTDENTQTPEPETVWHSPGFYGQEPEAAPQAEPFTAPQGTPYTAPQGAPYAAPQGNPYTASQGSPYAGQGNPYVGYSAPQAPYTDPRNPYASAGNPYGSSPYMNGSNPYAQGQSVPPQASAPEAQSGDPRSYGAGNSAQPPRASKARTRRVWPAVLVTAICCLLAGALVGVLLAPLFAADTKTPTQNTVSPGPDTSVSVQDTDLPEGADPNFSFGESQDGFNYIATGGLADMAEAVTPSIVGVLNLTYQTQQNHYYGFGYGYSAPQQGSGEPSLEETGSGSGVIISEDGYIVTNAHVVDGADALKILMNDGEEVDAVLVGTDAVTDLAVVKIDRTGLDAANLGDSDLVRVGEMAVAIGNPLGSELAGTVTMGIISAVDRTIEVDNQYIDVLQTDAAINPGNSGGALVNQAGQVIGITSAKTVVAGYDATGNAISAEGIGYAIPINNAKPIIEQLIRTGTVPRPALGVTVQLVTNMIESDQKGLLVSSVTPGGSADKAGIQVNDVITHMDGVTFETLSEFKKKLMEHEVGDVITLKVSRNEENIEIQVTLMDAKALETETEDETPDHNSQWVIPGYGGFDGYGFNPFG